MIAVQNALFRVVTAALAVSLINVIPMKRSLRRVISAGCGALLLLTVLTPLLRLRDVDPRDYLSQYEIDESMIDEAMRDGQTRARALIKEQTEAYIWDKAAALGAEVRAQVTLAALSEHYSYPYAVTLTGRWTASQRQALSDYIAQTLGIPPERQTWREGSS